MILALSVVTKGSMSSVCMSVHVCAIACAWVIFDISVAYHRFADYKPWSTQRKLAAESWQAFQIEVWICHCWRLLFWSRDMFYSSHEPHESPVSVDPFTITCLSCASVLLGWIVA